MDIWCCICFGIVLVRGLCLLSLASFDFNDRSRSLWQLLHPFSSIRGPQICWSFPGYDSVLSTVHDVLFALLIFKSFTGNEVLLISIFNLLLLILSLEIGSLDLFLLELLIFLKKFPHILRSGVLILLLIICVMIFVLWFKPSNCWRSSYWRLWLR